MKCNEKNVMIFLIAFCYIAVSFGQMSTPRDLRDLKGERANFLDRAMADKGYIFISANKSYEDSYTNWWHMRKSNCVTVRTSDGRIQSLVTVPNSDCNRDMWGNEHHENHRYNTDNDRYYHNDRSNRYRHDNDYHHDRDYSYDDNEVRVNDLVGRGAEWTYQELRHRGFNEQKKHQSDGKTYRIFYNYRTHQCIKTLSQNKRINSIQNSTHCN